jgi:endonuclease G
LPPNRRATPEDYAGTGYDKGHMANDTSQNWDVKVEEESFIMSNMTPQLPGLNRGIWKLLETSSGAWVFSTGHTLAITAGPIYDPVKDKRIGKNKVVVPNAFYKIVTDTTTGATLAFIFPQQGGLGNDLSKFQTTVAEIEKQTGVEFTLPKGHDKNAKEPMWKTDFKSVEESKKKVCKLH